MRESIDRSARRCRRPAVLGAGLLGLLVSVGWPAQAVEPGDDLVFYADERAVGTDIGEAGLVAGEIDQKNTDVRAGLVKTTEAGTVLFEIQLGEPDTIKRQAMKTTVRQSRDLAMRVRITDTGGAVDETHAARVPKCGMTINFKDATGVNVSENLPDTASWKLVCNQGWQKAFEALGDDALTTLKAILDGSEFKIRGSGISADRDDVLADLDFPIIDGD